MPTDSDGRDMGLELGLERFLVQFDFGTVPEHQASVLEMIGARILNVVRSESHSDNSGPLLQVEAAVRGDPALAIATLALLPGVTFAEPDFDVSIVRSHVETAAPNWTDHRSIAGNVDPAAPTVSDDAHSQPTYDVIAAEAPSLKDAGLLEDQADTLFIAATSNDPDYTNGSLWGMYGDTTPVVNAYGSQAGEAWATGFTGTSTTIVGVIDTGIDYTHPDLYLNVWLNQTEIPVALRTALRDVNSDGLITFRDLNDTSNAAYVSDVNANSRIDAGDLLNDAHWENGIDESANGRIDDLIGWDFVNNDNDPFDDNGHGTHVSGTIGGIGGNGVGVAGVNWNVQIVAMKFLSASGSGSTADAVGAVDYFTNAAVHATAGENYIATNNSWGGGGFSQAMADALNRSAQQDILFVAAAGNSASNNDTANSYPSNYSTATSAGYESVVAVASLTNTGALSSFSSYGPTTVDLAAPGSSIYSTLPGGTYGTYSGTSMATPHVTGAVALYASTHPDATAAQIRGALLSSVAATSSLLDITATGGRLDIGTLMDTSPVTPPPAPVDIAGSTSTTATLVAGTPKGSTVNSSGDQDWFKVMFTSGYNYNFAMDAALGSGLDTYLRLLDANGNQLAFNDDAVGLNSRLAYTSTTTGTFYVSAQGYSTSTGTYDLTMTQSSASLNLVGTTRNDILTGGVGNDTLSGLAGNDTLNGGLGADTMSGGVGNDLYYVDNADDIVTEAATAGTDSVYSLITYSLTTNVENLTLTGTAAINGTGNTRNNVLTGNAGDNVLSGGLGVDRMSGGVGNDLYYVDNAGDIVTEAASAGTDGVYSSIAYSLTTNVENLTLTGAAAINGTGNTLDNVLTGNAGANTLNGDTGQDTLSGDAGNDTLYGGLGNDQIAGGAGADIFVFNSTLGAANVDRIADFETVDDTIWLENNGVFRAFTTTGALTAGAYNTGSAATQTDDRIIYNPLTGGILYDADGVGGVAGVQFATLTQPTGTLSSLDFIII